MNLIHRHIFASVALTCGAAVGLFTFVLMLANALKDLLSYVLAGQLDPGTFLLLLGLLIPFVVSYALPMGMLTGILLVLGRMSSDREITALRSSGLSVAWISAPILFCALLGVGLTLLVNFQFMPRARVAYHQHLAEAVRRNPLSFVVAKTFVRDFPGIVLYAGEKNGSRLKDLWIWELDDQKRVRRFARAESGVIEFNDQSNKLVITLNHAQLEVRDEKAPEDFTAVSGAAAWDQASFDLPLDRVTGVHLVSTKLKWLTLSELIAEWRRLGRPDPEVPPEKRADKRMSVQITMHEKFATAFSVLSFALVAIPLGIKVSRKETSANLGLGLMLAMGYYFATIVVGWFDGHTALRPDLLMWVPNLALQSVGFWLFHRLDRARA